MKIRLSNQEVEECLKHWLNTKAHSYYGSSYGENVNRSQFRPISENSADIFLAKLKKDLPFLNELNQDAVQIIERNIGYDKKHFFLAVGEVEILIHESTTSSTGHTFNANAF